MQTSWHSKHEMVEFYFYEHKRLSQLSSSISTALINNLHLQGDSGGTFVCQVPGEEKWKLFGIPSWVVNCRVPVAPTVFTRVVNYLDWIQGIMAKEEY